MLFRTLIGLLAVKASGQNIPSSVCQLRTRSYIVAGPAPAPTLVAGSSTTFGNSSSPTFEQSFCLEVDQASLQAVQRRQNPGLGYFDTSGSILPSCQGSLGSNQGSTGAGQGSVGSTGEPSGSSPGSSAGSAGNGGDLPGSAEVSSRFFLMNGKLSSGSLFYSTSRSTSRQVLNEPFAASPNHQDIDTYFSVVNGELVWRNAAFDGGVARFCIPQSGPLRVIYTGSLPSGCSQVNIRVVTRSASSSAFTSGSSTISGPTSTSSLISPSLSNTGFSQNISSTQSSSTSTSATSPSSTSTDPVSLASSIITIGGLQGFCSGYLGYTVSQTTTSVASLATYTAVATITTGDTTITTSSTLTSTMIVASEVEIETVTPTVTTQIHVTETTTTGTTTSTTLTSATLTFPVFLQPERRQAIDIPAPLQTFAPAIISSACSLNARRPESVPPTTATYPLTTSQTSYETTPAGTVYPISTIKEDATISSGSSTTTTTGNPHTSSVSSTFSVSTQATATFTSQIISTATTTCTSQAAPTVVLARPTALMGDPVSAPSYIDDEYVDFDLPFPMQIGQSNSTKIFVTSNVVLSILEGNDEPGYNSDPLPNADMPANSAFGLWDDTVINEGTPQGIFYQIEGNRITFEYYMSHWRVPKEYYHLLITYSADDPGVFTYTYYQVSDLGKTATVGIQYTDSNGEPDALQYSVQEAIVYPGLVLRLNTLTGTLTTEADFNIVATQFNASAPTC